MVMVSKQLSTMGLTTAKLWKNNNKISILFDYQIVWSYLQALKKLAQNCKTWALQRQSDDQHEHYYLVASNIFLPNTALTQYFELSNNPIFSLAVSSSQSAKSHHLKFIFFLTLPIPTTNHKMCIIMWSVTQMEVACFFEYISQIRSHQCCNIMSHRLQAWDHKSWKLFIQIPACLLCLVRVWHLGSKGTREGHKTNSKALMEEVQAAA